MNGFALSFVSQIRNWDKSSQVAFALALVLLLAMIGVAAFGPIGLRQPAVIGIAGLFITAQIIIMWGNRGMVTPYTTAQRHFMAGDFEASRGILEELRATGKADANALTLLGNVYRQLGMLDQSEAVLREALDIRPKHHFPLYGFGRTLLAKADYSEAANIIRQAIEAGAPPIVQFDLGHALYRQGQEDEVRALLETVSPLAEEPFRVLMIRYLLYRLDAGELPVVEQIEAGLPYWRASAERFRHTPYGETLAKDVDYMLALIKEA